MIRKVEFKGWVLEVETPNSILITKSGESREYKVDTIIDVNQDEGMEDYVYLMHEGGSFTQVKFEEDNFLVIDKFAMDEFEEDGGFLESIGSYVFGENVAS